MPAAYAHLTFGRNVLRRLDDSPTADMIKRNQELFEIGLQGPDILFFFRPLRRHPVNRLGHALHTQTAASFLERGKELVVGEAELAYLLGFICHFTLDSECHTYVQYYMDKTGRGHSEIETDLERILMYRDGKDPMKHPPSGYLADKAVYAKVIASFYEGVSTTQVKEALTTMKLVGRLLTPRNQLKRGALLSGIRLLGKDHFARELILDPSAPEVFRESNRVLMDRMGQAQPVAIALMENYLAYLRGSVPLASRFSRTFEADMTELVQIKEREYDV